MKIQVFGYVTPCRLSTCYLRFEVAKPLYVLMLLDPEDGGTMLLGNGDNCLLFNLSLRPIGLEFWAQIVCVCVCV